MILNIYIVFFTNLVINMQETIQLHLFKKKYINVRIIYTINAPSTHEFGYMINPKKN